MPTPEALQRLRSAEERMKTANEELLAFVNRPDRQFSTEERAENKRLRDKVSRAMSEYWEAFDSAARS